MTLQEVKEACSDFKNAARDLMNADQNTYDSCAKRIIYLVTSDHILSDFFEKYLSKPININDIELISGGWGKLNLPLDKEERIAYGLQVLRRFSLQEGSAINFSFTFFYTKNINAALRKTNEQLFTPILRDIYNLLDALQERTEVAVDDKHQSNISHIDMQGKLIEKLKVDQPIGFKIIDMRDLINAHFYDKYNKPLLLLRNERCVIELLKSVLSQEEFFHRLSSLAIMVDNVNVQKLRVITGETDSTVQSIGLLEQYLNQVGVQDKEIAIKIFRCIVKIRQGYPVHGDQTSGLINAYAYLGLKYPVVKYESAWIALLTKYLEALEIVLEGVKQTIKIGLLTT